MTYFIKHHFLRRAQPLVGSILVHFSILSSLLYFHPRVFDLRLKKDTSSIPGTSILLTRVTPKSSAGSVAPQKISVETPSEKNKKSAHLKQVKKQFIGASSENSLDLTLRPSNLDPSLFSATLVKDGRVLTSISEYLNYIHNRISSSLEYPLTFRRRGVFGIVDIKLVILPSGTVEPPEIIKSSGHTELDDLVLQAIQRASPFPPFKMNQRTVTALKLKLPFEFRLN